MPPNCTTAHGATLPVCCHTSTAITEGYYIEPDRTVDTTPAAALDRVLRPGAVDHTVLTRPLTDDEEALLDVIGDAPEGEE